MLLDAYVCHLDATNVALTENGGAWVEPPVRTSAGVFELTLDPDFRADIRVIVNVTGAAVSARPQHSFNSATGVLTTITLDHLDAGIDADLQLLVLPAEV